MNPQYQNGPEIHVGDLVSYAGQKGEIMFVADTREYSVRYPVSDWPLSSYPTGFMIEFTNRARLFLEYPDEHLVLISGASDKRSS
jgi:hypothetical protein